MQITNKITITNEDNMQLMARYPDNYFDLAIVDPPYGINLANMNMGIGNSPKASKKKNRKWTNKDWDNEIPDGLSFSDCEYAWTSFNGANKIFRYSAYLNKSEKFHPTQKPPQLYKWLLGKYAKQGDKILDTHLGSGSIAIACHDFGFELTACELDAEYYEKAVQRIKTHVQFNASLFEPEELRQTNTLF